MKNEKKWHFREDNRAKTILIIEDTLCCQQVTQLMLRAEMCCDVIVASNGREGLECLFSLDGLVDLILLDIDMPIMTGLEFLSVVKQDPVLKKIPIILQTGERVEELQKGMKMGASGYIQKPYTSEGLYAAINKLKIKGGKCERTVNRASE